MSITVRIIFWGLIGFVPNGHKELTALLVDPGPIQEAAKVDLRCRIREHFGAVYLLDGKCDSGDCVRIPENGLGDALFMGLGNTLNGNLLPLRWLLRREDLELVGDEEKRMKLRKPFLSFLRGVAPRSPRQARYFSWLQNMDTFTGGLGKVQPECVNDQEGCSLNGRFKLQGGMAGSCHLVHDAEPKCSRDSDRSLRIFDYEIKGRRRPFRSVVADAVSVDIEIKGDSVLLQSKELPGQQGPGPRTGWAKLRPDDKGKLTLVVVNFPPQTSLNEAEAEHSHIDGCPAGPHSNILFDLLAAGRERTVQRTVEKKTRRGDPGSCEQEADELARLLTNSSEVPHSTSACDGAGFRPPGSN